jgi:hypothetical protein
MGNATTDQWGLDSIVADPLAFSAVSVSYRRSDGVRDCGLDLDSSAQPERRMEPCQPRCSKPATLG